MGLVKKAYFVASAFAVIASFCGVLAAQNPPMRDRRVFRSAVELTTITATVRDQDVRLVTGLPREAFEVYEDGVAQPITQFTN